MENGEFYIFLSESKIKLYAFISFKKYPVIQAPH